jgi:hypothetical protein
MILDLKLQTKITKKNIDWYLNFYKNIKLGDVIEIDPQNLQKNSNTKINVKCDLCDEERFIKFQAYTKNINRCEKYPIYTCDKCSHIKLKEFNMKNYGVEYYSQHPDRNEKVKKTSLEKFGAEHFSKTQLFKEKTSKTNLEKFGFENPFEDSNLIRGSFMKKWGVDHPSKVPEIKQKTKNTNLQKWGFEWSLSSPLVRLKISETMIQRYETPTPMISDEIRRLNTKIATDPQYLKYIGNSISAFKCDKEDHVFYTDPSMYHNRKKSNLSLCTICHPVNGSSSIKEKELLDYIKSIYVGEIIHNYSDKLQIDIFIPELKLGFEFNGLYWNSEEWRAKNYHLEKTEHFKQRDIRIIHIWEDDWLNKQTIIKSQIRNWIRLSGIKIPARKCRVSEVKKDEAHKFLDDNHIQGSDKSIIKLGLYFGDELVSLMTFNKLEGRKKMSDGDWNLSRFCNKLETNVMGGASKLMSHFIKQNSPSRIISYADKDWSIGDLYYKLGLSKISESKPDYKYIVKGVRKHKQNFKKSNLKMNESMTESEWMISHGFKRIWDCGKIKFEIKLQQD